MDKWIGEAVAKMHNNRITQKQLAEHIGVTKDWISLILLGKEKSSTMRFRIETAIDEIIAERSARDVRK